MARYFLELAYNGAAYCGWQIQPNAPSVQQTLGEALSRVLRQSISVVGAGRTDTGVHAAYYVAHFDAEPFEVTGHLLYHLNAVLPRDIALYSCQRVSDDLHARFSATERGYRYYIQRHKSPFFHPLAMRAVAEVDMDAMNRAASHLLEVSDFTSFAKLHTDNKTNICNVTHARWSVRGDFYCFEIRANRFLRNMVRSIVGTLLDVGRGKVTYEQFVQIVEAKSRAASGSSAVACGLYLTDVRYPSELFEPQYSASEPMSI